MLVKKSKILVSIIIPNYAGELFIKDCINSIYKERANNFEVIVVDDASQDTGLSIIKKNFLGYPNFKLIELKKNGGTVNAINTGIAKSQGEFIFILGNDTKLLPGWPQVILDFFKEYPQAGIAQAKILKMGTNNFDYAGDYIGPFGFLIERAREAKDVGQFDKIVPVFSIKGGAMIVKKEAYLKLGGMENSYRFGWEEPDFTWRAWIAGYETYFLPYITVYHAYGTKRKNIKYYMKAQIFYHGCKNNITSLIKNLSVGRLLYMLPINIACYMILSIMFLFKGNITNCLAMIRGMLYVIGNLPTIIDKRRRVQKMRTMSDHELFSKVGAKQNIGYYFGKATAYVTGKPF